MKKLLPILLIAFSASASELVPAANSGQEEGFVPLPIAKDGEYRYATSANLERIVRVALPLVTISYAGRNDGKEFNGVEKAYVPEGDSAVILFFKRCAKMILIETGDGKPGAEYDYEGANCNNFMVNDSSRTIRFLLNRK